MESIDSVKTRSGLYYAGLKGSLPQNKSQTEPKSQMAMFAARQDKGEPFLTSLPEVGKETGPIDGGNAKSDALKNGAGQGRLDLQGGGVPGIHGHGAELDPDAVKYLRRVIDNLPEAVKGEQGVFHLFNTTMAQKTHIAQMVTKQDARTLRSDRRFWGRPFEVLEVKEYTKMVLQVCHSSNRLCHEFNNPPDGVQFFLPGENKAFALLVRLLATGGANVSASHDLVDVVIVYVNCHTGLGAIWQGRGCHYMPSEDVVLAKGDPFLG